MRRALAWIAAAQVLVVVLGFLALWVILKFCGWPARDGVVFNPLAAGLRLHGLWMFAIVAAWSVFAIVCAWRERGVFAPVWAAISGVIISVAILCLFLWAAMNPSSRPIPLETQSSSGRTCSADGVVG